MNDEELASDAIRGMTKGLFYGDQFTDVRAALQVTDEWTTIDAALDVLNETAYIDKFPHYRKASTLVVFRRSSDGNLHFYQGRRKDSLDAVLNKCAKLYGPDIHGTIECNVNKILPHLPLLGRFYPYERRWMRVKFAFRGTSIDISVFDMQHMKVASKWETAVTIDRLLDEAIDPIQKRTCMKTLVLRGLDETKTIRSFYKNNSIYRDLVAFNQSVGFRDFAVLSHAPDVRIVAATRKLADAFLRQHGDAFEVTEVPLDRELVSTSATQLTVKENMQWNITAAFRWSYNCNYLVDISLVLAPLLPPYVLLEIVDYLDRVHNQSHHKKIATLQGVYNSIDRLMQDGERFVKRARYAPN